MFCHTIVIIFILCILGCKRQEDTQAKFIAFDQVYKSNRKGLLINKVHKPARKIRYGFADNDGCGGTFGEVERIELTAAITEALQTWRQALSVMSLNYLIAIDPNSSELMLGADDHAGINWLYDFHQRKSINKDSCPHDYVYEPKAKGCAPRYPLIFAIKQAHFLSAEKLLPDDPNIDLNQQDSFGNTALHYAANLVGLHGRELYDFLLSRGAKDTLSNKNNATAQEVLAGKHSKFIATMFAAVHRVPEQRGKTTRRRLHRHQDRGDRQLARSPSSRYNDG